MSSARRAIAETAALMDGAFTAESLHDRVVASRPGIGLATVYRAVAAMADAGYLARVGERDGAALYAVCGHDGHHHHAVCERCGAVTPVECAFVPSALPAGFAMTRHEVAIYGVCAECQGSERGGSR
ncbi:MAG: transcriptional repressor [Anaerosomatales bacterium]|nr:transcriptional repressor [Anaerosomatales bacterium]